MPKAKARLIDLSHTIENGTVTYKGLPAPLICDHLSRCDSARLYAPGTEFQIGRIDMVANTGTYMDTPFHRYADGHDLADVDLHRVANLDARVLRFAATESAIDAAQLAAALPADSPAPEAVLVHTGWSRHWGQDDYFEGGPYLTECAALWLRDLGVKAVGIDCHNIDDTRGNTRPVHSVLLAAGIYIIEHMTRLQALPDAPFKLYAVPVKIRGMGTFPVRAFAQCSD